MNGFSALCWFAALLFAAGIILFSEIRNANDGIEQQTFCRWVENHKTRLEVGNE